MKVGLTVSAIGHVAILGLAFFAFPEARPFTTEAVEALPVDLVEVADVRDLLPGNEQSKIAPKEKPQPKPEVSAEIPLPKPAERAADKPVEAAREPSARPEPPPEPEPQAKPEQLAALPEPAAALPEERAPVPAESRSPRARPKPPRVVSPPKPTPEKPDPIRDIARQQPEREFNPDDISALLNKQEPAGGGDPNPVPEPQTIGSIDGNPQAALTQSELDALKARLRQCWNPPVGVREAAALIVTVRINLLQDGSLASPPQLVSIQSASNPLGQVAAESAVRAVAQCAPFGDILRPETYALWNQIDFVFDPREMLGG
jgi:hypothetical protein